MQYNHHAALVHTLWLRKKREKERKINTKKCSKQQQTILFARVPVFFFFNQPTKETKIGGKNWRSCYRCTWYTYDIQGRFGQPRTFWRRDRLQKAATTRDQCVVHMCASSVLSRRATSTAPAQRKNCRYFST